MHSFITIGVAFIAVLILIYMLLKKNDIKMTLLLLGVILMYLALLKGENIGLEKSTGSIWLDPFQAIVEQFSSALVGPGFVILMLGGYSSYMNHIGANRETVRHLTKPILKMKSVYLLIPMALLIGNILYLVIPSASNLAIILMATLYPILRTAGVSRLSAAAVIGTSATIVPTPLGSDNIAIAGELGLSVTDYVFKYHALVSIPTLVSIGVIHFFWQKRQDQKEPETMSYAEEMKGKVNMNHEETHYIGWQSFVYSLLPLLPIIILFGSFIFNGIMGKNLTITVQLVSIVSFIITILIELCYKRSIKQTLEGTNNFFTGMGNAMGIVALLVSAQVFVQGLTSIGIINLIQHAMTNMKGAGVWLILIMVAFTAVIVLLSGSGTALLFAMIPLMIPLSAAADIRPEALAVPMQLSGSLLRAVSPVSAVILILAGSINLAPMSIVKRTAVPMILATVLTLILSLIVFR